MTVPAAIEKAPGTGASCTLALPSPRAFTNGAVCSHVIPCLVAGAVVQGSLVSLPDRTAWLPLVAELPASKFGPHRGARRT